MMPSSPLVPSIVKMGMRSDLRCRRLTSHYKGSADRRVVVRDGREDMARTGKYLDCGRVSVEHLTLMALLHFRNL
jgi:hypothetical protein